MARKQQTKYPKEALVDSQGFSIVEKDILAVVLNDNQLYSVDDARKEIKKFKGGIH
ncbi:hypothetical protein [Lentilactobacillus sp. Marseille-Q4993]|uniref:hypothetical protein n=1 Tax=Lentilactobacillus sp. Marseille-Q4993 TaxID=3039492 RepID=UPI0024BCA614|nr:hypothetical protein [Lentilactobacillus sp. Marseille-Q4993]